MIYGYARVSVQDQNLDTQIENALKYGVYTIAKDKISGVSQLKVEIDFLICKLTTGDTLVVIRMNRLGRNTIQLLQFVEHLREKDVHFAVLNLEIDTRTSTGKFFLTVISAFSELDREMFKEKQIAGIKIAKQKRIYRGRIKNILNKMQG